MNDLDVSISKYSNRIRCELNSYKPVYKTYEINNLRFVYDAFTNKIARCNKDEYNLLNFLLADEIDDSISKAILGSNKESVLSSLENIYYAIVNNNFFKSNIKKLGQNTIEYVEFNLSNKLEQIILDITEKCNMRCIYCAYNSNNKTRRNHGNNEMTLECAKSAIRYLHDHGELSENICITFYGGEPLMRFSFIKTVVEYAKSILNYEKAVFGITTNGTYINDEIAKYLYENKFNVTISIDGPKEINDQCRLYADGKSAYNETKDGIERIIKAFGKETIKRVSLSMVYAPPYSTGKLNRIQHLWDEMTFLPREINTKISYASIDDTYEKKFGEYYNEDKNMVQWALEKYIASKLQYKQVDPIVKAVIEPNMAKIHNRIIYNDPKNEYFMNGCCIPGARKILINTMGDIRICERIDETAPIIGNIEKGINNNVIKDIYLREYGDKSLSECSKCWAIRMCDICYVFAFMGGGFNGEKKNRICEIKRQTLEDYLKVYSHLLEIDENIFDELKSIRIA